MEQCMDGVCIASMHAHGLVGQSIPAINDHEFEHAVSNCVGSKVGIAGLIF